MGPISGHGTFSDLGYDYQYYSGHGPTLQWGPTSMELESPLGLAAQSQTGYALINSANGPIAQQAQFRQLGRDLASGKATYSCQPDP